MKNTRESINQQIQFIAKEVERNILEVELIPGELSRFFIYNSWEASYGGMNNAVTYNSGNMLEITDFIEIPHQQIKGVAYKQALAKFIEKNEFMNIKFSDKYKYWIYAWF